MGAHKQSILAWDERKGNRRTGERGVHAAVGSYLSLNFPRRLSSLRSGLQVSVPRGSPADSCLLPRKCVCSSCGELQRKLGDEEQASF